MQKAIFPAILALIFPAALLVYVWSTWVDIPFWDQYDVTPLFQRGADGSLGLGDFFEQHNEHRLFFPKLVMYGLGSLTDWDTRFEGVCTIGFVVLTILLLGVALVRSGLPWLVPAVAALMCSLTMYENWTWGFQLQIPLCILAAALCVAALSRIEGRGAWLLVATLCAVVASYSFGNGVVCWPLGALWIVLHRSHPRRLRMLLAWCLAAALTIGFYFFDYESANEEMHASGMQVGRILDYVCVQVGGYLDFNSVERARLYGRGAAALAAVLLVIFAFASSDLRRASRFWLGLGAFGLGAVTLIALGRASQGGDIWITSRYANFAALVWVALAVLPFVMLRGLRFTRLRAFFQVLSCAFVVGIVSMQARLVPDVLSRVEDRAARLERAREDALRGAWGSDAFRSLYPQGRKLVETSLVLRALRLSAYRDFDPQRLVDRPPVDCGMRFERVGRELRLQVEDAAGKEFRCLFSLGDEPPTVLADGRQIPLVEDDLYTQSMQVKSPLFVGHHARFDDDGRAVVELAFPTPPDGKPLRVYFAILLVDMNEAYFTSKVCKGASFLHQ